MAKKTEFDIRREERISRPPRLQGKERVGQTKGKKQKKRA